MAAELVTSIDIRLLLVPDGLPIFDAFIMTSLWELAVVRSIYATQPKQVRADLISEPFFERGSAVFFTETLEIQEVLFL